MKKIFLSVFAVISLNAQIIDTFSEKEKSNDSLINDKKYKKEVYNSWDMYKEDVTKPLNKENSLINAKPSEKTIIALLAEILETNKENLKTNKKILEVLQNEFDPQPKKITLSNGRECFENEDADCYVMPSLTKESKILVFKNFFKDATIENAAKVVAWTDRHVFETTKRANLQQQALMQFGDQIAQYSGMTKGGYIDSNENFTKAKKKEKLRQINKKFNENNLELVFYFTNSFAENVLRYSEVKTMLQKINVASSGKRIPAKIILSNKNNIKKLQATIKLLSKERKSLSGDLLEMEYLPINTIKDLGVFTTPSVGVLDKNNKTMQVIISGPFSASKLYYYSLAYLRTHDLFKDAEISDYKILNSESGKNIYNNLLKTRLGTTNTEDKKINEIENNVK